MANETNEIANSHDFSRCHCGGDYCLMAQTEAEKSQHLRPAQCRLCGAFRYLSEREYQLAQGAKK